MFNVKKGFTLIELLVVIAIIAILAGILFPVFAQAREKARQTSCLSNLKNIGMAVQLYTDDNHETYPLSRGHYSGTWQQILMPYVKDVRIFYCPSSWIAPANNDDISSSFTANYTANAGIMGDNEINGSYYAIADYPAKKMARVKSPSNVAVILEGGHYLLTPSYAAICGNTQYIAGLKLAGIATPDFGTNAEAKTDFENGRHNEGFNVVYADSHASFSKAAEFAGQIFSDDYTALRASKNPLFPASW